MIKLSSIILNTFHDHKYIFHVFNTTDRSRLHKCTKGKFMASWTTSKYVYLYCRSSLARRCSMCQDKNRYFKKKRNSVSELQAKLGLFCMLSCYSHWHPKSHHNEGIVQQPPFNSMAHISCGDKVLYQFSNAKFIYMYESLQGSRNCVLTDCTVLSYIDLKHLFFFSNGILTPQNMERTQI